MSARDHFHDVAKAALIKDGWTITHDPYKLEFGPRKLYVDLGAEKIIAAEKGEKKIAVEVKSFVGLSDMHDLEESLGQFVLYEVLLEKTDPLRELHLMVRDETWENVFEDDIGELLIEKQHLKVIVFDEETEEIIRWIP